MRAGSRAPAIIASSIGVCAKGAPNCSSLGCLDRRTSEPSYKSSRPSYIGLCSMKCNIRPGAAEGFLTPGFKIGDNDLGTLVAQQLDSGETNSRGAAGDQRNFVLHAEQCALL
jgi:hypothetical protein